MTLKPSLFDVCENGHVGVHTYMCNGRLLCFICAQDEQRRLEESAARATKAPILRDLDHPTITLSVPPRSATPPKSTSAAIWTPAAMLTTRAPESPTVHKPSHVPNGYYTVVFEDGIAHRTLRLRPDKKSKLNKGGQIALYFSGHNNKTDYTGFAFVHSKGYDIWWSFRQSHDPELVRDLDQSLEVLLHGEKWRRAGVAFGLMSELCCFCGEMLTKPKSIRRGMGPTCAKKHGF